MARINELMGMNTKDINTLKGILNTEVRGGKDCETVAEYIKNHDVKTERRTSKKGIELVKVFYPTGKIAEYEVSKLDRTIAFEF